MQKKILPLLFAAICTINSLQAQSIFTVDNTPGTSSNYRTLQGAIDSSAAGSILLVQGGTASYGIVTISKTIALFGPGYWLGLNPAPNTQNNFAEASIDRLIFTTGSAGSMVSGLSFTGVTSHPDLVSLESTSNISISRCRYNLNGQAPHFMTISRTNDLAVKQCYFSSGNTGGYHLIANTYNGNNNLQFYNCLFDGSDANPGLNGDQSAATTQVIMKNCSFTNFSGSGGNIAVYPLTISNCVVFCSSQATVNSIAANNNVGNVNYTSGGNNITNATPANTYVLNTNSAIISPDGKLQLKAGSAALNYGDDGKDAGAFGGTTPYVLSGIPIIPNIYLAEVLGAATSNGGLKVRIKAKANQ